MNIIICYTPLQVLIAEQIIKLYPEEAFFGVMINFNDNSKHRYYFNRLSKACHNAEYIAQSNYSYKSKISALVAIHLLQKKLNTTFFKTLFIASIDDAFVTYLAGHINHNEIKTFDDGTANIRPNSSYYKVNTRPIFKVARNLLNINSITYFKERSKCHYTIYSDHKNIIDNTHFISLYPISSEDIVVPTKTIKIFLGQPFPLQNKHDLDLLKQITYQCLSQWGINHYFPHPREDQPLVGIEIIETKLVIEDYLVQQLAKHPSYTFEIYTFASSAALNICNLNRVQINIVKTQLLQETYPDLYRIFEGHNLRFLEI